MTYTAAFGLAGGLFATMDAAPYIRDTIRGETVPHRLTWTIWSVLSWIAVASQDADGAEWSLGMAIAQAMCTTAVCALSLRDGVGGLSRAEIAMGLVAAGGVAGWAIASDPVVATACVVLADSIGVAVMAPKILRDPGSETVVTYALAACSGACAAVAVGGLDGSLLLYPVYFLAGNALIAAALVVSARRLRTAV
jgi:hypothetical protein